MASSSCCSDSTSTTPSILLSGSPTSSSCVASAVGDPIKRRYPMVNEDETQLPRQWSSKDRCTHLGLSGSNLRVHYKGVGKNHKDAASVRATHAIPAACGIYYFEVKVISKGREGYMGIGLSTSSVNMSRLPGWEKNSYGYHGDDGNSFCSSGAGQPYGPTFTTGDVIGCCVNLIDSSCFYTKNGTNLGVAFKNLPPNLYPTVGLQTPGEVVEANFGASPFLFDIDDYVQEWREKTRHSIEHFNISNKNGEWQTALQKIVSSYLIHNGYCATAEAFAHCTGQQFDEELASIRNRQKIQKLILSGQIGEAIEQTQCLYPGLLEQNTNLLFSLKCRQFIEMVNGTDSELSYNTSSSSACNSSNTTMISRGVKNERGGSRGTSPNARLSSSSSSPSRAHSSTPPALTSHSGGGGAAGSVGQKQLNSSKTHEHSSNGTSASMTTSENPVGAAAVDNSRLSVISSTTTATTTESELNQANTAMNGDSSHGPRHFPTINSSSSSSTITTMSSSSSIPPVVLTTTASTTSIDLSDNEMDTSELVLVDERVINGSGSAGTASNGVTSTGVEGSISVAGGLVQGVALATANGSDHYCRTEQDEADMDIDQRSVSTSITATRGVGRGGGVGGGSGMMGGGVSREGGGIEGGRQLYSMSEVNLERILQFGRELHSMGEQLKLSDYATNETNIKVLKDAFSLLAYSDPWNSSVGHQLHPVQREPICTSLNSAILELQGLPKQPPLELAIAHTAHCVKLMSKAGIGSCAFASINDYLH